MQTQLTRTLLQASGLQLGGCFKPHSLAYRLHWTPSQHFSTVMKKTNNGNAKGIKIFAQNWDKKQKGVTQLAPPHKY